MRMYRLRARCMMLKSCLELESCVLPPSTQATAWATRSEASTLFHSQCTQLPSLHPVSGSAASSQSTCDLRLRVQVQAVRSRNELHRQQSQHSFHMYIRARW